jgi:porin
VAFGAVLLLRDTASATPPVLSAPVPSSSSSPGPNGSGSTSTFFEGLKRRQTFFGDLFGIRSKLSKYGISVGASETSEELGNVAGGTRQGAIYDGLTQMTVQLDTNRAFGLYGGTFNASALQIHGHNLSAENLDTLQTASGIEGDQATRLWELWYQQQLRRDGRLDVKIGQQSLDQEFISNQSGGLFVGTLFGWPIIPSYDLPGGGPAYPLSALGVRLRARPNNAVTLLGGVFNGNPAGSPFGDPQANNASGTNFALNGGVLAIGELQYSSPQLGGIVYGDRKEPLARTLKFGAWYDSEDFNDLALDSRGFPLASPASNGVPRSHHGNYSAYATIDQLLAQDANDPFKTVNGFARIMGTPLGGQNLISFGFNAGLTLHEPIKLRRDDTLGIGIGYTRVGSGAAQSDADAGRFGNGFYPIRNDETFLEATYQYSLYPWISLQPDFQYVINPGGGLPNPGAPLQRIHNEPVFGLRTIIAL